MNREAEGPIPSLGQQSNRLTRRTHHPWPWSLASEEPRGPWERTLLWLRPPAAGALGLPSGPPRDPDPRVGEAAVKGRPGQGSPASQTDGSLDRAGCISQLGVRSSPWKGAVTRTEGPSGRAGARPVNSASRGRCLPTVLALLPVPGASPGSSARRGSRGQDAAPSSCPEVSGPSGTPQRAPVLARAGGGRGRWWAAMRGQGSRRGGGGTAELWGSLGLLRGLTHPGGLGSHQAAPASAREAGPEGTRLLCKPQFPNSVTRQRVLQCGTGSSIRGRLGLGLGPRPPWAPQFPPQ
ncbi:collagen alpha-1(I) chain-like [Choloepus didactylus]|uniref:collagen alpha-1(I) chain-like n=1 Tax=Choloepus didactylus TaxID=27675 RepID=UPI00189F6B1A|nr:collagen alpha-1(I) chain-like [Choloepus didactylus]